VQKIDLIVFDWDGTLIDSAGVIVQCIRESCRDIGIAVPSERDCRFIIGLGLQDALTRLLPQLSPSDYPRLSERYRHHFLGRERDAVLFDGVEPLLEQLCDAGYLLAVATGKSRRGLDRALDQTGLAKWFAGSRCADETFSKPHPAMLLELMDDFATGPQHTLMVGDTTYDLQMARNAGCGAIAVASGAHERGELELLEPLACLRSIAELGPWLATQA
jgi:phosphoglycolate phosphatase